MSAHAYTDTYMHIFLHTCLYTGQPNGRTCADVYARLMSRHVCAHVFACVRADTSAHMSTSTCALTSVRMSLHMPTCVLFLVTETEHVTSHEAYIVMALYSHGRYSYCCKGISSQRPSIWSSTRPQAPSPTWSYLWTSRSYLWPGKGYSPM